MDPLLCTGDTFFYLMDIFFKKFKVKYIMHHNGMSSI